MSSLIVVPPFARSRSAEFATSSRSRPKMAYLAAYGGPRTEQSHTASDGSFWAPLHQPLFLAVFFAAFVSNIGTWMQSVAAAWLMTSLAPGTLMVGLVQTLSGLPVFLFITPAVDFDRFVSSVIATFGGTTSKEGVFTVTPTPSKTMSQLVLTPVGTLSVFGFKTPIPFPFGVERTGYLVTDIDLAIRTAHAAGADIVA